MIRGLLCCVFTVLIGSVLAQDSVFPGDANYNGVVDQYDILHIGYAVGTTGPARILTEDSQTQSVAVYWTQDFPAGPNMIHADADGNGVVDMFDFFVWSDNYSIEHDEVTPLDIPIGIVGDARVAWNNDEVLIPVTGGQSVSIPIGFVVPEEIGVNGVAFRLSYHPAHFAAASFDADPNWLTADGDGISLQKNNLGQIDLGMTRLGVNPLPGGGPAGTVNLIVIDDMVDLLETAPDTMSTFLRLEQVLMVNDGLEAIPVYTDSLEIKLYRSGTVSTTETLKENTLGATLFPNPFQGEIRLRAQYSFQRVVLFDPLGREIRRYEFSPRRQWGITDLTLVSGCYYLQLEGEQGISRLRLLAP